jgi:hypothetical protein
MKAEPDHSQSWGDVQMTWEHSTSKPPEDPSWKCRIYRVRLSRSGQSWDCDYYMGLGCKDSPSIREVLHSLQFDCHYGSMLFQDCCDETGTSADSRQALEAYLACQRQAVGLRKMLGSRWREFLRTDFNT